MDDGSRPLEPSRMCFDGYIPEGGWDKLGAVDTGEIGHDGLVDHLMEQHIIDGFEAMVIDPASSTFLENLHYMLHRSEVERRAGVLECRPMKVSHAPHVFCVREADRRTMSRPEMMVRYPDGTE